MEPRRVVVTGLGALTPIGNTLPEYWEGLISGTSGAAPITYFDAAKFKTQFACELKGYDFLISWIVKKHENKIGLRNMHLWQHKKLLKILLRSR